MRETVGAALAVGAPVVASVRLASSLEDLVKDIAITGEMTREEEQKLGQVLRATARQYNQHATEVGAGLQVLVASGITSSDELQRYAPILAKAATATRASVDDLGNVFVALKNNLSLGAQDTEAALNMLAYAGKQGQFELKDMAKWMPSLAPMMQALGVTGKEAVAELGAALQVARKGAGSSDEAANNLKNFLAKVTAPDTLKDFEKAGIDLKSSLMRLRAEGMTPMMAMLEIIRDYMKRVGGEGAAKKFEQMASAGDLEGVRALSESYGLGTLFQDMQAMSFIRPALANLDEFKRLKADALAAGDKDVLGADFKKRMESSAEQMKRFGILARDIGLSIGEALLPPLVSIMESLAPVVRGLGAWVQANPVLVKTVVGLGLALTAGKLAVLGLGWAVNFLLLSPFNGLRTALLVLGGRWLWLKGLWQAGAFAAAAGVFGRVAVGARLAAQAVLFLGRAVLLNPIGLTLTAIAGAAYLIWRNWDRIGPLLGRVWDHVKAGFAAAWDWLRGLPARMLEMGRQIVGGLIEGIKSRLAAAGEAIKGLGRSVVDGLKNLLGIRSPSRVFAELGGFVAEGFAGGIGAGLAEVKKAAGALSAAALVAAPALAMPAPAPITQPPAPPAAIADAQRVIRQVVEPVALPELADAQRVIRQVVEPVALPELADAQRVIRQAVEPVALPELADAQRV
ncbi:MAG: phage tail tape measure protein, partial [Rhodocyclaceae bacterium]|nr:phage tail tape measure protein [Rhodocyclaceae bacterium]